MARPHPEAPPAPLEALPLLAGYAEAASPFDEMLASDGSVRPHWRCFVAGFAGLGAEGRQAAAGSTQRLLRESGIAFNVYADPDARQHAWRLDLVPALLPQAEWTRLARGLVRSIRGHRRMRAPPIASAVPRPASRAKKKARPSG